ncbi:transmembrane protein 145 [Platysternon megacephalum]|uniref:Transmembrane protein 145 n=1 Tax=Platysternon megacephalum TaxID=55544 RepID=A0A4D9DKL9_9SAUR|nr:transmembrane protein 145 [Platysternon megacephalum]
MAIAFHNHRVLDRARADHALYLREKDGLSQCMDDCLTVDPGTMVEQLLEQRRSLLERCREEMNETEKVTLQMALETQLTQAGKTFLKFYRECYEYHTINQGVLDRARADHAEFLKEKDDLSQRPVDCLKVDPSAMAEVFAEQRRSLLRRCRDKMMFPAPMKPALLTALERELTWEAETFLKTYRERYQRHISEQSWAARLLGFIRRLWL